MTQSVCIISTRPPYAGQFAREALDTALVSASYEIPTSLLLMGDGVYQLLDNQSPGQLPRKNLSSLFKSLALYGIETVYIDRESMDERNIEPNQLLPLYTLLEEDALPTFIQQHDKVLNF